MLLLPPLLLIRFRLLILFNPVADHIVRYTEAVDCGGIDVVVLSKSTATKKHLIANQAAQSGIRSYIRINICFLLFGRNARGIASLLSSEKQKNITRYIRVYDVMHMLFDVL